MLCLGIGIEPVARRAKFLKKSQIAHLIRAAASITDHRSFVMIGTGAVIVQLTNTPLALMQTREIDIYVSDGPDADAMSDLIDGSIGEGSQFDETFGYYAHGVGARTACLPDDWQSRAITLTIPGTAGVTCLCPDIDDIALSKICAGRDKDRSWIGVALGFGFLDLNVMRARAALISNLNAPAREEIVRRIDALPIVPDVKAGQGGRSARIPARLKSGGA